MSRVYFKKLGSINRYGWYAYAEDDVFVLGEDYPREGGELYRGKFKEDKIPYFNKFKRECPEAYDKAVKYFNSRPTSTIEVESNKSMLAVDIKIKKTVAEAIEEIENNLYLGAPLTMDTMILALGALKEYEMSNHIKR